MECVDTHSESLLRWASIILHEDLLCLEDVLNGCETLLVGLGLPLMRVKMTKNDLVFPPARVVFCCLADRLLFRRCSFPFRELVAVDAGAGIAGQSSLQSASCPALHSSSLILAEPLRMEILREWFICHNYRQLQA
jgi:hypothetical protein